MRNFKGGAGPWREAVKLPGSLQMKFTRDFFESLRWWELRPARDLLARQPGDAHPDRFIAAAATEDGRLAVFYLPASRGKSRAVREMKVRTELLPAKLQAFWFDPASGRRRARKPIRKGVRRFKSPAKSDWVLVLEVKG